MTSRGPFQPKTFYDFMILWKQFTGSQICFAQQVEGVVFLLLPWDHLSSSLNHLSNIHEWNAVLYPGNQKPSLLCPSWGTPNTHPVHETELNYLSCESPSADAADWVIKVALLHGNTHSAHFKSSWEYNVLFKNTKCLNMCNFFFFKPKAFQIS